MEKSIIRVVRGKDFFGMARKLKVVVNDKHVADLKYNQVINIKVRPGIYSSSKNGLVYLQARTG